MSARDQDEKLWRYLGGQPATPGFSELIQSDPAVARRLAELAMIECALLEEGTRSAGQAIMRRRRNQLLTGVGAIFGVALLAFAGWKLATLPEAPGTPLAASPDTITKELVSKVRQGQRVKTSNQPFEMAFAGEDTSLAFAKDSEFQFQARPDGGKQVSLNSGKLNAQVSPQEAPLSVVTPHLSVEVVGTEFDVDVTTQKSEVLVNEGLVEVNAKGLREARRLSAGSGWRQNSQGRGFSVAVAKRITRSPTIDTSNDNAWTSHPAQANLFFGESATPIHDSEQDHSSTWKAAWDDTALYVLIEVKDDEVGNSQARAWANDSVEIFVDADGSRGSAFDGINDHFLFFEPGKAVITPGIGALDPREGIIHQTHRTADGFRAEVRLPWSALGIQPEPGLTLGFNVASNDSDESDGNQRSQLSWTPKFKDDWSRPDRMGFLILYGPDS